MSEETRNKTESIFTNQQLPSKERERKRDAQNSLSTPKTLERKDPFCDTSKDGRRNRTENPGDEGPTKHGEKTEPTDRGTPGD